MNFSLVKGARVVIDDVTHTIDQHDKRGNYILISMDGLLVSKSREELLALYMQGQLVGEKPANDYMTLGPAMVDLSDLPDISGYSESEIHEAAVRHKFIEFALRNGSWNSSQDRISDLSLEFLETHGISISIKRTAVYESYKRYTGSAGNWLAQLPMKHRQGNWLMRKDEKTRCFVKSMFDKHYLTTEQHSIAHVYDEAEKAVHKYNKSQPKSEWIELPNPSYFYRYMHELDPFEVTLRRRGYMEAKRDFPSGAKVAKATRPLMRVEMDHTRGNIVLKDKETGLPWGCPTITLAVDAATGCVVGLYIYPEAPNFNCILGCLRHTVLPKDLGKLQLEGMSWTQYGIPREIVCDNGPDFHASGFPAALHDLGCDIVYCGVGQPQQKPHVERTIGSLSKMLMNRLPGTTFSRYQDTGAYDPEKMSDLSFREFVEIVVQWICTVYHNTPTDGMPTTPAERWEKTVQAADIRLPYDPLVVERLLGHTGNYTLNKGPLVVDGIAYSSEDLGDLRRRFGLGTNLLVRYFEENLNCIEVIDPQSRQPIQIPAVELEYTKGLTRHIHRLIQAYIRQQYKEKKHSPTLIQARIDLEEKIEKARLSSKKMKKGRRSKLAQEGVSSNAPGGLFVPLSQQERPVKFKYSGSPSDSLPEFDVE